MSSEPIRLIFYLPNLRSYLDRVYLLDEVAKNCEKVILITSRLDVEISNIFLNQLEIIEVEKKWRFPGATLFNVTRHIKKLIHKEKINVVHDTFSHLLFLFYKFRKKKNFHRITSTYIDACYDIYQILFPRYHFFGMIRFKDHRNFLVRIPMQRLITRYSNKIIVQAPGLIERLQRYHKRPSHKVVSIGNNFELSLIKKPTAEKKFNGTIELLFVGGFSYNKGCDRLVSLIEKSICLGLDYKVTCLGGMAKADEKYFSSIFSNNSELASRFDLKGYVEKEELNLCYQKAHFLFHATRVDGSPRVVLEALARGIPVIGSRHPGITVLDPKDEFIQYIENHGEESLLKKISLIVAEKEKWFQLSQKGEKYVIENHSSDVIANQYVELYQSLLVESELEK